MHWQFKMCEDSHTFGGHSHCTWTRQRSNCECVTLQFTISEWHCRTCYKHCSQQSFPIERGYQPYHISNFTTSKLSTHAVLQLGWPAKGAGNKIVVASHKHLSSTEEQEQLVYSWEEHSGLPKISFQTLPQGIVMWVTTSIPQPYPPTPDWSDARLKQPCFYGNATTPARVISPMKEYIDHEQQTTVEQTCCW